MSVVQFIGSTTSHLSISPCIALCLYLFLFMSLSLCFFCYPGSPTVPSPDILMCYLKISVFSSRCSCYPPPTLVTGWGAAITTRLVDLSPVVGESADDLLPKLVLASVRWTVIWPRGLNGIISTPGNNVYSRLTLYYEITVQKQTNVFYRNSDLGRRRVKGNTSGGFSPTLSVGEANLICFAVSQVYFFLRGRQSL